MVNWRVVPISEYQRLDVRDEDLLNDGHFRKCDTYRSGGGYDQFHAICEKRLGRRLNQQFVVQLYGCHLDCPYCYVTRSGVHGAYVEYSSDALAMAFMESGQQVFHLMGGAPALYLHRWPDILERLPEHAVFHSDLLCTEGAYESRILKRIAKHKNALYAVNVKGVGREDYERNTRKAWNPFLFWKNLGAVVESGINFYVTFTAVDMDRLGAFRENMERAHPGILADSFVIPLIEYKALPFVDRPAGA